MREEEGEKESIQAFFSRSSEFRRSEFVEPRTKVHLINKGYAHVQKRRDFTEDPNEEIWGHKRFWAYEVFLRFPTFSTTLQEVGFFPTLVYFYLCAVKGLFGLLWPGRWLLRG